MYFTDGSFNHTVKIDSKHTDTVSMVSKRKPPHKIA